MAAGIMVAMWEDVETVRTNQQFSINPGQMYEILGGGVKKKVFFFNRPLIF